LRSRRVCDLRYALRSLRKSPGFTVLAVLALALGIGVNTAVFTIADWFLFRPLAVSDPGALTYLAVQIKGEQSWSKGLSYMDLTDIRADAGSIFDGFAGSFNSTDGFTFDGKTEPMAVDYVTDNFFETIGVKPALGRLLLRNEGEVPGEDPVLVLSNLFWKTRFHADLNIIGKMALVNGHSVTIVGFAPPLTGWALIAFTSKYVPSVSPIAPSALLRLQFRRKIPQSGVCSGRSCSQNGSVVLLVCANHRPINPQWFCRQSSGT
jgi:putative ABC transport system permease protein